VARIRTIKPEFWTHQDLSEQPEATHMLAGALLNYADDEGYFNAHPALIKAACFPLRELTIPVTDSLKKLEKIGYVKFGIGRDGKRYGWIVTFDDHQRVNRPTPSKIKRLLNGSDPALTAHYGLIEDSPLEGKGKEGNGKEGNRPTVLSSSEDDLLGTAPEKRVIEEQRISQITDDAIATFNASTLVKRNGGLLSAVSETVGRETRVGQVRRCVKTARDICVDRLKSKKVTREFWEDYWSALADDDFTAGRTKGKGHENWKPDFEYFTRKATMLKVYEKNAGDGE
jgi:hypothetical protein